MTLIYGVDISEAQGEPNLKQLAMQAQFAFVRALNGTILDKQFRRNWAGLNGLTPIGMYQAWYPSVDWNLQTRALAALWLASSGQLPPVMDIESPQQAWGATWRLQLASSIQLFRKLTGCDVMLYTSRGYWQGCVGGAALTEARACRLWIAEWPKVWTPAYVPTVFLPWESYAFHQYSNRGAGADYGVDPQANRFIDLDVCDSAVFQMLLQGVSPMTKIRVSNANESHDMDLPLHVEAP